MDPQRAERKYLLLPVAQTFHWVFSVELLWVSRQRAHRNLNLKHFVQSFLYFFGSILILSWYPSTPQQLTILAINETQETNRRHLPIIIRGTVSMCGGKLFVPGGCCISLLSFSGEQRLGTWQKAWGLCHGPTDQTVKLLRMPNIFPVTGTVGGDPACDKTSDW